MRQQVSARGVADSCLHGRWRAWSVPRVKDEAASELEGRGGGVGGGDACLFQLLTVYLLLGACVGCWKQVSRSRRWWCVGTGWDGDMRDCCCCCCCNARCVCCVCLCLWHFDV